MTSDTISVADFRKAYPAFANVDLYPEGEVDFQLNKVAPKRHSRERWGDLYEIGCMLHAAHLLTLSYNAKRAASTGGSPGEVVGNTVGGSVRGVSYSRSLEGVMRDAGHWNLSVYGIQHQDWVRLVGAGPSYIGPDGGDDPEAWPGPWVYNIPNPSQ